MKPRFHTIPDRWTIEGGPHEHVWLYDKHAGKTVLNPLTAGGEFATDADAERFADTLPPVVRETNWGKHPQLGGFCYWREYDRQGAEIGPFFIVREPERYRAGKPYEVCESGAGRRGGAEQRGAFSKLRAAQKFASEANAERNGYLVRKDTL